MCMRVLLSVEGGGFVDSCGVSGSSACMAFL